MKLWLATLMISGIIALANGCAVQGTPFARVPTQPDEQVIYVYRPYHYGSSALRPAVICGGDEARIGPGGYHAFVLPAGKTTCQLQTSEAGDEVEIDADPHVHYIREELGWGWLTAHPLLNPVDNDQAQTEIRQCCVLEPDTGDSSAAVP